ncbi:MAG: hypothetical protein WD626_02985 [Bauldia sp.]
MLETDSPWNSLEIAKLAISALGPASVVLFGWFINRRLKQIEEAQWKNRKVIEKRIEIFDRTAPDLNRLYCYFMWIGPWKEVSPKEAITLKRRLDHAFHVNRYLIGEDVFHAYQSLMAMLFRTYGGAGQDALIRTKILGPDGDRRASDYFKWQDGWESHFDQTNLEKAEAIHDAYTGVMQTFKRSIGL